MILYEYPLNERVRTLLRLEDLFDRLQTFARREHPLDHHVALVTLFEILDVAARADLKSDLLQELERQRQSLAAYRGSPDVSTEMLEGVLSQIDTAAAGLGAIPGRSGQHLRDNEWLMSIRSRTIIAGGACEFDLPSYHAWQHRPDLPSVGAGETPLIALAPAIANAVYMACGQRLRSLPMKLERK